MVNSPESQRSQDTPALRRCHRRSRINASFSPNALIFCLLACTFDISAAVFSLTCHPVGASPVSMGRRDLDYDEVLRYIGQFGTFQVNLVEHSEKAEKENIDRKGSSSGFGSYLQEVDWL